MSQKNQDDKVKDATGGAHRGGEIGEAVPQFRSITMPSNPTLIRPSLQLGSSPQKEALNSTNESKGGAWCVYKAQPLPIFPLERTVKICEIPRIISGRIWDSLRLRSVHAEFNGSTVICKTSSFVTYTIDLYAQSDEVTLLEVMRRSGCGIAFRVEKEAIINAAQGLGGKAQSKLPVMMKIPADLLKAYKPPTVHDHEDTLLRSSDQLSNGQRGARLFTVQNLASITSTDKVHCKSAQIMSKLIMEDRCDIRGMLAVVLNVSGKERNDIDNQIQNSILTIFSNAMSSLPAEISLKSILEKDSKGFVKSMVPSLVGITNDIENPHNACLALRCLCLLLENSCDARSIVSEEAYMVVKNAETYGRERHFGLEKQANSVLTLLKS